MAADPLALRAIDPDDTATLDRWMANTALVFTAPFRHTAERREFRRPTFAGQRLTAAYDADALVATYRSYDWQVTVPGGGSVAANAISSVTVLPTHRRRGALTGLIHADLAAAARRGAPVAVLIASEAGIYGRYGFGPATETATWTLDLRTARIAPDVPRRGTLELVGAEQLRPLAPAVFEAARTPGHTDRNDWWWDLNLDLTPWPGDTPVPTAAVVHRDPDGVPRGYCVYSWKDDWTAGVYNSVARVRDLQAETPQAYAALWGYLAELDLISTVSAQDRPVDEPLPWLLTDPRAARRTESTDFLWARLLDPAAALTARRYESPGSAVFELTDPLGHAAGRFALEAHADGTGRCTPSREPAELTLPVGVLSACWLGGGDLPAAHLAGRVLEHAPGATARLARLLRTTRAPWTGTWF